MPCVGFILRPQKRPRVLTSALAAAAAARGVTLLALDPDSTPQQWQAAGVDVIVHKVPDEQGLDQRLEAWSSAAAAAAAAAGSTVCDGGVLLDPPAAVRRLQDREAMLAPLADGPVLLTNQQQQQQQQEHQSSLQQHTTAAVSIPPQLVLHAGCTFQQALQQVADAGLQMPLLVKPLVSTATDSCRPAGGNGAAAAAAAGCGGVSSEPTGMARQAAAAAAADRGSTSGGSNDGHTLGLIWTSEGLRALIEPPTTQQQQQHPIHLPVVLQQYVPHEALYKLYVIGPSCVLTRRNTLTPQILEEATAAAAAGGGGGGAAAAAATVAGDGKQGVVILPRLSANKWTAAAAHGSEVAGHGSGEQQQQQQQQQQQRHGGAAVELAGVSCEKQLPHTAAANGSAAVQQLQQQEQGAAAIADPSVVGDPCAPPLWAMQQLAAYLRSALGLNLFNVDIIRPCDTLLPCAWDGAGEQQQQQQSLAPLSLLVVDINYFPGYDKVPGAEKLFADFLAHCAQHGGLAS